MSLYDDLAKISQDVKIQREQMKYEAATNLVSVQPFIRALGYNLNDLSEVYPEYVADPREFGGEAVDYAILRHGAPILVIEAKAAVHSLNEQHWRQLYNYFGALDVQFGVLTNGIDYRFYTDLKKTNVMDKEPYLVIDLLNLDARLVSELEGFTQARFDPERVVAGARKRVLARLLKQEMNNPSDEIVRHFVKQLTSKQLTSDQVSYYAGLVREAWRELLEPSDVVLPPPPPQPPQPDNEYVPVYGYHDGQRLEAHLLRKSVQHGLTIAGHQIRYNGEMTWLKNAAVMAIRSVDPEFEPTRTYPNGFKFWHVIDPLDGKERTISCISDWDIPDADEELRQRVLSS